MGASNLDQCSNYTVRILPKPILPGRHLHPQPIQAKQIKVSTWVEGCKEQIPQEPSADSPPHQDEDDHPEVGGDDPFNRVAESIPDVSLASYDGSSITLTLLGVVSLLTV